MAVYFEKIRFKVLSKKRIYIAGIDIGPRVTLVLESDKYHLWRSDGHNTWAGVGMTEYIPSTYYLVVILEGCNGSDFYIGSVLKEYQPGSNWKKFLNEIKKEYFV